MGKYAKRCVSEHPSLSREHNYLAWAIDHANKQGFQGGTQYRDQIAKFQVRLFNNGPDFPRECAAPYELKIGSQTNKGNQYFSSLSEVFTLTYGTPPRAPTQFMGYYGVDARLMLIIGVENNWPGAQQAYDYLHPLIAVNKFVSGVSDLAFRAGWALEIETPITAEKFPRKSRRESRQRRSAG